MRCDIAMAFFQFFKVLRVELISVSNLDLDYFVKETICVKGITWKISVETKKWGFISWKICILM